MRRVVSLKRQMILYFSIAFSLTLLAFGGAILSYNSNSFLEQSYADCRQIVHSRIALIDTYFLQLQNVSRIIATDVDVVEAVASRNGAGILDYAQELYRQRNVVSKLKQVDVLGNIDAALIIGGDSRYLYFYGRSPRKGYDFSQASWFVDAATPKDLTAHFTGMHDTSYLLGSSPEQTVSLVTPIVNTAQFSAKEKAYLLFDFQLEPMLAAEHAPGDIQIAIFQGETPVYFVAESLSTAQQELIAQGLGSGEASFMLPRDAQSPTPYLVVRESSRVSGWTILGIMSVTEIEEHRNANTLFVALLILLSILMIALLSLLISNSILVPIKHLLASFDAIASGAPQVSFPATRSVEINLLSSTAQHMLRSIDRLKQEAIQQQALLSREQFKVLQHQINPHLVNNTLQSIKALAFAGDASAISRTTTLLGRILSYSVYNPLDMVPLSQELAYIENYIALQQMRYPGITYGIECDPQTGILPVPKLIVQPIVENAIEHGLSAVKEGRIDLCVEEDGEAVHIMVVDNGVGFDVQKLEAVRALLQLPHPQPESDHIGILNVHQRIEKIYGIGYGVSILSKPGMQTTVVITVGRKEA